MKNKSYFVDRIIKLRGGDDSQRDELMNLTMVDILNILSKERVESSKSVDVIPFDEPEQDVLFEDAEAEPEAPPGEESEDFVSIVKRFLFTSPE
jgi:glycosylphosphatidylinositol transamidase (GPIT) subunit GPI8